VLQVDREAIKALPEKQQAEALQILETIEQALRDNPLTGYKPHPKQVRFHEGKDPMKIFWGGNQSGKTTAGLLDDIIQAVDRDSLPRHLEPYKRFEPPFLCRIICPDFTRNMEGVIFHKLREWLPKGQLVGDGFSKAYDKTQRVLRFKNGSEFDFLSYEQDLDKFGGATKDRIHYDEEPPENIRREGMMRLMRRNGDEIFTMTPLLGLTWMFSELYEPFSKGHLQDATVVVVDMDDNPYLHPDAKRRALAGMSKEEREARKEGRFVHFAGMIYDEFKRNEHVIPEIREVPPNSRVYVGIDPGMRHMAAVVWTYLTPEDTLVVFDELALQGHTAKQVSEAIKMRNAFWGQQTESGRVPLRPDWYVIDPSARNVMHNTGRSDQMEYTDAGIVTILGQNSVTAGINRVKQRLQARRLLVTANCQQTVDQFRKYRWATETRSEDDAKEKPVKTDDHLLDALRYVVSSRPYANEESQPERFMSPMEKALHRDQQGKRRNEIPRTPFGGVYA
jgi:phage terminase large subunit-like protein